MENKPKKKYIRKGQKSLFVYVTEDLHRLMKERAQLRNITLSQWTHIAIMQLLEEENRYI